MHRFARSALVAGFLLALLAAVIFTGMGLFARESRNRRSPGTRDGTSFGPFQYPPVPTPAHETAPPAGQDAKEAQAVRGFVRNTFAEPLSSATVATLEVARRVHRRSVLVREGRLVTSDREGAFEVRIPRGADPSSVVLDVRHADYCHASIPLPADLGGPVIVVLQKGESISGVVVFVDGTTPVPGVTVVARGIGANYSYAEPSAYPPAHAELQTATTDARGGVQFHGLRHGLYQIDVTAPGLAVVPPVLRSVGRELLYFGPRGTVAKTGSSHVKVHVVPLGSVAVRVTDAANNYAVPSARVGFVLPEEYRALAQSPLSLNSEVALANGRLFSVHGGDLAQSVHARLLVGRKYPATTDATCRVQVRAPGYGGIDIDVPIASVGASSGLAIEDVALATQDGTGPVGGVRLRLLDVTGRPIRRHVMPLVFQAEDSEVVRFAYQIRFDNDGNSDVLSIPAGSVGVRGAAPVGRTPISPKQFTVREGKVTEVELRLVEIGGFELAVADEHGHPIGDFGVRTSLRGSTNADENGLSKDGAHLTRATWVQVPGLGGAWRGQHVGYRPGLLSIEVTRHGYAPFRTTLDCVAGTISALEVVLERDASAEWAPLGQR